MLDNDVAENLASEISGLRMMLNEHAQAMRELGAIDFTDLVDVVSELKTEIYDLSCVMGELRDAIPAMAS